jgi:hypothetical protein
MNPMTKENATQSDLSMARKISYLLTAHSALVDLFHAYNDDRGLSLANRFEDEAHTILRDAGIEDMPTFQLAVVAKEICHSVYQSEL